MKTRLLKRLRKDAFRYRKITYNAKYDIYEIIVPFLISKSVFSATYENKVFSYNTLDYALCGLRDIRRDYIIGIVNQMKVSKINKKLKKL